jgi:hypothetical protein
MIRASSLFAIAWAFGTLSEPLRVLTHLARGPHFVGQAIEVRAEVEGVSQAVAFEVPKTTLAEIQTLAIDPEKPSVGRFLVIPKRPGPLDLPPFRARSGDRSGVSRPTRLTVANIPAEGRSAAFLGGVGAFEVKGEAEPMTLRAGQTLEFRLKISGQAAWGSVRSPDLSAWKSLGGGLRVEPLPEILEGVDPPVRTFRYRIRPKVAGRVVLPPVAVASFEPKTGRFSTRTTSSVPITIEKLPTLDPTSLRYEPVLTSRDARSGYFTIGLSLGLAGLATLAFWFLARQKRRPRPADPVRLALELSRHLVSDPEAEGARRVVESLTTYLERVGDRKPGALTPPEARDAFGRLTKDQELAELAERLVIASDRARYRGRFRDETGLVDEGRAFFERVAVVMGRKKRVEGGPREAVETA